MLYMHGGAWTATGKAFVAGTRKRTRRYARLRWRVYSTTYQPGGRESYRDVERVYRRIRQRHPNTEIAVGGESSGGHLALDARPAPPHNEPSSRGSPTELRGWMPDATAREAFGDDYDAYSPARHPGHARVLASRVATDPIVGPSQSQALDRSWRRVRLTRLAPGDIPWTHGGVSRAALERYLRLERRFLELTHPHRLNDQATQRNATW